MKRRSPPLRDIVSFEQDEEHHWVARLECGHRQHVRHRPPLESRPWVETQDGRRGHIGTPLACPLCTMPVLPTDVLEVRRTRTFRELDMPAGLRATHRTRADTWGRIVVERGYLHYEIVNEDDEPVDGWVLRPGVEGTIAPAQPHRVTPKGEVAFFVVFFRSDHHG